MWIFFDELEQYPTIEHVMALGPHMISNDLIWAFLVNTKEVNYDMIQTSFMILVSVSFGLVTENLQTLECLNE